MKTKYFMADGPVSRMLSWSVAGVQVTDAVRPQSVSVVGFGSEARTAFTISVTVFGSVHRDLRWLLQLLNASLSSRRRYRRVRRADGVCGRCCLIEQRKHQDLQYLGFGGTF